MMDVTHGAHGEVVIHLVGDFDAGAAGRLSSWLGEVPSEEPLVLDFSQVGRCEDFELARVARALVARDGLVVRGLTRHRERMLRYFGVRLASAEVDAADDRDASG